MDDAYSYQAVEIQKVPCFRRTEPALKLIFDAKRKREQREAQWDSNTLLLENKEEYLDSLAEELKDRSRALKHQLFEIGRLIYEAKKILPHGEFKKWINLNFQHGYKTSYNCMRVYIACLGNPSIVEFFNPSCLYIIAKPSFPEDLREALFEGIKGPVDVSVKELIEVTQKYKNGEISLESEEIQNLLIAQQNFSIWKKYQIEVELIGKCINQQIEKINNISISYLSHPLIIDASQDERFEDDKAEFLQSLQEIKYELSKIIKDVEEKCK